MRRDRMSRRRAVRWLATAATAVAAADVAALLRWPPRSPALDIDPAPHPSSPESGRQRNRIRSPRRPEDRSGRGVRAEQSGPSPAGAPRDAASAAADGGAGPETLAVICREDWGAAPPAGDYRIHRPRTVTVHHTGVAAKESPTPSARVRAHQRHHLDAGFVDLSYHFIIGRGGTVYEGRPVRAAGETFTDYDPTGHFVPCLEGNFDEQAPTDPQVGALAGLLAWAAGNFRLRLDRLRGHRELAPTACPGDTLQALIDDASLQRTARRGRAAGGVDLVGCGL